MTRRAGETQAAVSRRRQALLDHVKDTVMRPVSATLSLAPGDPLWTPPSLPLPMWIYAEERLCDVALMVVAYLLSKEGLMDHHWVFHAAEGKKRREPWGFVTDTYCGSEEIHAAICKVDKITGPWSVQFLVLGKELSPHYPGSCTPIVVYSDGYETFIPRAVAMALDLPRLRP